MKMDKKGFYKQMIALTIPVAFESFIYSALNFVDIFMIGMLGETSVAAVGAANKVFFLLQLAIFGISSGAAIFSAQYWGKRDEKNVKRILGICIINAFIFSLIFTMGTTIFPNQLIQAFNNEKEFIDLGVKYIRIVGISYGFTAITFCYIVILRSIGQVRIAVIISVFSILLNTFLNWVLIFGNLGASAMGVEGAALATAISRILQCILLLSIIYIKRYPIATRINELFDFSLEYLKKFYKTTIPVIFNEITWSFGIVIYSIVFGRMGDDILATTTIAQTVEQMSMVLFFGMGNACAIMIGNEIGAGNEDNAIVYSRKYSKVGFISGVIAGVVVILTSHYIVNIFNVDLVVKEYTKGCLIIFGFFLAFKVFNLITIIGILRSGGDTRYSLFLDVAGVWLIGVPLVVLTGLVFKLSIYVVYIAMFIEEVLKFIFGLRRVLSKRWLNNLVKE